MASNGNGKNGGNGRSDALHWAAAPAPQSIDASLWLPVTADDTADADAPAMQVQALLAVAGRGDDAGATANADADSGSEDSSTPAELTALIKAALADHDSIMAATFSFSDVARIATREDFLALLETDDDETPDDPHLAAVAGELESCAFTRWRARLTWLAEVPVDERTLIDELERLIIEPAVTWRELELEWQEASAVATASSATVVAGPTVVCLDARTAARVKPEQVSDQNWAPSEGSDEQGRLSLSLFGLPANYSRYRLVLFTGDHLRRLLGPGSASDGDEIVMPSLDLIERHAPELLSRLLPADGLPPIALPWFTGRLTPYGDTSALNWTSPPVGPVRLRSEDILLACLY